MKQIATNPVSLVLILFIAVSAAPLAVRMRPRTIEEFIGQRHFLMNAYPNHPVMKSNAGNVLLQVDIRQLLMLNIYYLSIIHWLPGK